jgi:DNA helicase HerA-like ATPase
MFFNLRRCFVPHERGLARTWQERAEEIRNEPLRDECERFDKLLRCDLEDDRIILARAERNGDSFWAGLPLEELLANHAWITGGTGSGKTFELLSLVLQVLTRPDIPIIVADLKGEFAALLLDLVLPALTAHGQNPHLLTNLRVIRPFDDTYLPMLRITQAEEGVPHEIQSWNLAASLAEALAEDLGARMNRVFLRMTTLAIELNEPLTAIKKWLEDPMSFAQAARRSKDGSLRTYAMKVFERENQNSIQSLLARLDTFLLLPSTRLALSAPSCVSFSAALESGLTIVDLGDPPAGAERVSRFWAGILIGRLTRAILSRPVKDDSPRCWVIFEEFQEALAKDQAQQFGRLLALARFKKLSLWFCNQQPAQLAAIDPTLVKLLHTNADLLVFVVKYFGPDLLKTNRHFPSVRPA